MGSMDCFYRWYNSDPIQSIHDSQRRSQPGYLDICPGVTRISGPPIFWDQPYFIPIRGTNA